MVLRALFAAALLAAATSETQLQRSWAQPTPLRLVLGYYVPYDATSWESLQAHTGQLDFVSAQWVTLDGCGGLGSRDDESLNQFARVHGLKVLPSLLTGSAELNHQVLADDDAAIHAVEQIVDYTTAEGYDGFDIDMEGLAADDRAYFTRFVGWLADGLHAADKLLTLALPAKASDVTVGWAGAYDYAALGSVADLVTVMAYEYRGPFSGPGSVAPFAWVRRVASFAASQIPSRKVLLGLAFYGYDWNVSSGGVRAIGYPWFVALADRYQGDVEFDPTQRSLTFGYEAVAGEPPPSVPIQPRPAHQINVRQPPTCDVPVPQPTATTRAPKPTPEPGTLQAHQVWYEDSASASARLDLVDEYGLGGIATWRLGLEDPNVWPTLDQWRESASGG